MFYCLKETFYAALIQIVPPRSLSLTTYGATSAIASGRGRYDRIALRGLGLQAIAVPLQPAMWTKLLRIDQPMLR